MSDDGYNFDQRAETLEAALQGDPDNPRILFELGATILHLARPCEAVDLLHRAARLAPRIPHLLAALKFALRYDPRADGPALKSVSEAWASLFQSVARPARRPRPPRAHHDRLKIGYLSTDFHDHPVGRFIDGVLACHDRAAFDIYCYSLGPRRDEHTARLEAYGHNWRNLQGASNADVASSIRGDGVQLLVDISGNTTERWPLGVFFESPAPITAAWVLGGGGTSGMTDIDYVIGDPHAIPAGHEPHYTEKVVRLPHCYLAYCPPANVPDVVPPPSQKNGVITFGCFNSIEKMNDAVIVVWAEILRRNPGSRLVMQNLGFDYPRVATDIESRFRARGIDNSRLTLRGRVSAYQYLESHADIDIQLDPFPYTGGMTTCDSLWMGVPVVTIAGEGIHARHGATILANAGHVEWVTQSAPEYVERVCELASKPAALRSIRYALRPQLMRSQLCDVLGVTRALEAVFTEFCAHRKSAA